MKVLFRAEVEDIGKLAESQIKLLNEIDGKFYAIGFASDLDGEFGITDEKGYYWACNQETKAIHFEDMLDSENNPIFASLDSETGKGGDIIDSNRYPFTDNEEKNYNAIVMMIFNHPQYVYQKISDRVGGISDGINNSFDDDYTEFTVIGIKK